MSRPLAVVTGASGGIGAELARCFAGGGYDLFLTARRVDELQKLAAELSAVTCHVLPLDLADPLAPGELVAGLAARSLTVDVLVANAGFGLFGPFAEADERRLLDLLQVNVTAVTHLTRLLLPGMQERKRGRVLTVASTAAFQPGPLMAAYYASKAYVLSLSEALWHECRGTGVTVTCLCPGPTTTGFASAAAMGDSKLFDGPGVMAARTVAEAGYRGCLKGKRVVVPGVQNRIGAFFGRHLPRRLILPIVARVQARKEGES
jgi:hypothetical protein